MEIIKDKSIKPYIISSSANGFSVEKKYKNQDGGKSIINIGFYSSIESCLIKIIKEKANPKKTITLKEYVERIEAIKNDVFKSFEIKPKVKIKKK